jgi:lysophospholipase L1-like esterase
MLPCEALTFASESLETQMDYRIAAIPLAPLLLAQGLRVRRNALRLPEPPGPRAGTAGEGPPLRLLVTGDSAAAGVGAATQDEALSGALVRALQPDFHLSWRLKARTGLRTRQVLARLASQPPEPVDAALVSLGVNDVTGGTRSAAFVAQQRRLVQVLRERYGARLVLLTALPPMYAFPALPQPLRWTLGERARAFTRLLRSVALSEPACELLELRLPLDMAYIATDGFHPGPRAYEIWAEEAAAVIRSRFSGG